MTQNTKATAAAETTAAEQAAQAQAQAAEQAAAGMSTLLAAAVAQGAQAAAVAQRAQAAGKAKGARSNKKAYGVFVTVPEGHLVCVRYDLKTGRELASWWLVSADGSWALGMRTKTAALAWLDAQGDVAAQAAAAVKLAGGADKARATARQAQTEILAHAKRA